MSGQPALPRFARGCNMLKLPKNQAGVKEKARPAAPWAAAPPEDKINPQFRITLLPLLLPNLRKRNIYLTNNGLQPAGWAPGSDPGWKSSGPEPRDVCLIQNCSPKIMNISAILNAAPRSEESRRIKVKKFFAALRMTNRRLIALFDMRSPRYNQPPA